MPETLHKSHSNKVFAGVCGGLAEYFNVDPTLIRLAWALAVFVGGTGLILYILAMIIMPDDPAVPVKAKTKAYVGEEISETEPANGEEAGDEAGKEERPSSGKIIKNQEEKRHQILGLILVSLGGYFLLERFFPFFHMRNWWPVILILIGVFILFKGKGGNSR